MTDSWWLKVKRAQEHLEDIERYAGSYADSHPYETVPVKQAKRKEGTWRYRLRFIEQPDPWIAILLGDFVHNLRSALDHVVVASVPKKHQFRAGFPIAERDPWRKVGRRFTERNPEVRKSFLGKINGLSPEAQAFVKSCQPYHRPDRSHENISFIISSLENADKHRKLITISTGLERPSRTVTLDGQSETRPFKLTQRQFLRDGAEFTITHPILATKRSAEVDVQCRGTAAITIQAAQGGRGRKSEFPLLKTTHDCLRDVEFILKEMEAWRD